MCLQANLQTNASLHGEFERVAQKIDQDLSEGRGVPAQCFGHIDRHLTLKGEAFLSQLRRNDRRDLLEVRMQREVARRRG